MASCTLPPARLHSYSAVLAPALINSPRGSLPCYDPPYGHFLLKHWRARMRLRWIFCFLVLGMAACAQGDTASEKETKGKGEAANSGSYDWPQWQGVDRTAISKETGLLRTWPKVGPELAWKVKGMGDGYSTPSIAAGRIFVMGNRGKTEYVMAFSEKDGSE